MEDQTVTNPESEAEAEEQEVTEQPAEGAEDESEEGERQTSEEDESEEVDWEGVKLTLPKAKAQEWREGWLRQSDYTRKTQEVAERRRALEAQEAEIAAERQRLSEQAKADEAIQEMRVDLKALEKSLKDYTPEVWQALQLRDAQNGTNETQAHLLRVRQLEAQRDQLKSQIAAETDKRAREQQEVLAKRSEEAKETYRRQVQETQAVLAKEIGWNQELAEKTEKFALKQGLTMEELGIMASDPRFVKLVHLARIGSEALQKVKKDAGQSRQTTAPQPVQQVRPTRAPASKAPSDRDDVKTWMQKRNEQVIPKRA